MNKAEEKVPLFRWHWQNLTEDEKKGHFPWHGRAWFTWNHGDPTCRNETTLEPCWNIGGRALRLGFGISEDYERTAHFNIGIPGLELFLSVDSAPLRSFIAKHWGTGKYPYLDQSFRLYLYEWAIWLQLWGDENESHRDDPWWKKMHAFHIDDFFLGKVHYSKRELSRDIVTIHMPEGEYKALAITESCLWKRSRCPARPVIYTEISFGGFADGAETSKPPSFAGKGENSWDQDDNAIWSTSFKTADKQKAANMYRDSVLNKRKRYGEPCDPQWRHVK